MNYKLIDINIIGDERGKLAVIECLRDIPFEIKRAYWIYDTHPEQARGFHSHKAMEQVVVAMDGSCEFELDDGTTKVNIVMNRPDKGLYIGKNIWRVMKNFSYGCKLIVFASDYYDEKEYIRNYDDFLEEVKNENNAE